MSVESEVRSASEKFYAALNRMANGEAGTMTDVWSHSADATALHPIGGRDDGWEKIRGSFDNVASIASDGQIKLTDQIIHGAGDLAYELGTEKGKLKLGGLQVAVEHRVTNVYRREGGAWKVVHHHTDLSPAMMDVLARLQAKG
jgi:ketosteroid isomerase-like protein